MSLQPGQLVDVKTVTGGSYVDGRPYTRAEVIAAPQHMMVNGRDRTPADQVWIQFTPSYRPGMPYDIGLWPRSEIIPLED